MARNPRAVLLTVDEAAERLRVNHMTVRRRIAKGRITVVNLAEPGTRPKIRITEAALADYIAACALT